jgi:uncharacterized membrane protein
MNSCRVNQRFRPHGAFVCIAIVFGLASAVLTPPLQSPDEPAHWMRTYQLSQGHWLSPNFGGEIPRSIVQIIADFSPLQAHPQHKTSRRFILDEFHRPLMEKDTQFVPFPNTSLYSIVPYAPQTLAMLLGRSLGLPGIALLYLGRFASVFAFALLGWAAIRIAPICKWPMCLILTCPMSLFLAGSVSADPITIGLSFLAIALVLRCALSQDRINWQKMVALLAVMLGVALCKSAYAPLSLLLLAIDRRKLGGRLRGWVCVLAIIAICLAACAAWSLLTHPLQVREAGDDPVMQLKWIEHHPIAYTDILCRSLATQSISMVNSSIGILGWLDTPMPRIFFDLYPLALAAILLTCEEQIPLPVRPRAIAAGVLIACIVLIVTANYLVWNKIGQSPIIGLQGRYFLPLAPLLFLIVRRRGSFTPAPVAMAIILSVSSVWMLQVICYRYY